ncbi:MAG: 2-oxoacid:acceptor oxidoreductase subunit alpha [Syntrophaceae bacterium]|jgi:2-oxoglutarate/2-oxoacid ferredoxin oxidoreductase subunit alpha|nr:2-oxoacid:acceptor oxidoreductase subunit alpha [Syntrophaceae bacterium]
MILRSDSPRRLVLVAKEVLTGIHFMNGDEACCEGALAAGCRFFAGYPITPATEIAESMSRRLPQLGGIFIQMEDEIASMAAILGASWGGVKSMTSTSGPGFSLMMENIGLGICTETPCVVCNVQRGGPSTGLPTLVGQGDVMQARWGAHGHYEIIALCPSSPQEMFDMTIRAFNLSEYYRLPVLIMADEVVGHMNERVIIPREDEIEIVNRRKPSVSREDYQPYEADDDGIAPMANCGDGYRIHITGLTHDERGYPAMNAEGQEKMVARLVYKIRNNRENIIRTKNFHLDDADVVVVSYGISARSSMQAVRHARNEGMKAGLIKLETLWPFPEELIRSVAPQVKAMIMAEINGGQMALELERCAAGACSVSLVSNFGGAIIHPGLIYNAIVRAVKGKI